MGRKNIFQTEPVASEAPSPAPRQTPARRDMPEAIGRGPVGIMGNDLLSNSIREIDPARIEGSALADRLSIEDEGIAALRESMRQHGQQVPILVRPTRDRPGHFKVVYGRRRLAALAGLGIKAKAIIRTLDEEEALVAQGQENNLRRNPSFIEKASFAAAMRASNYATEIILAALGIDKTALSKMKSVTDTLPYPLIELIGAAPESGRRKWMDLADLLRADIVADPVAEAETVLSKDIGSDRRLADLTAHFARLRRAEAPPALPAATARRVLSLADGKPVAELRGDAKAISLKVSKRDHPAFGDWLEAEAETLLRRLHAEWQAETAQD
ncbi:plasmid partitioning protein RepB [Limimaricola litoreus]|uniref:Plasmid partitioning protein RepB n=1 Tax=Limimaricola litoreus TaxID=2955316 RepID=A0A9X2FSL2_9RHOB|nr:plasmid partitioning protein RepB [Limimaricola litoreus]MCP1170432.1 plasmid partitioning protein RepB [Limimaricola litoreus]